MSLGGSAPTQVGCWKAPAAAKRRVWGSLGVWFLAPQSLGLLVPWEKSGEYLSPVHNIPSEQPGVGRCAGSREGEDPQTCVGNEGGQAEAAWTGAAWTGAVWTGTFPSRHKAVGALACAQVAH